MGFQEQMIKMMIDSKSPDEIVQITEDMMPQIVQKLGPQGITRVMGNLIPGMVERMNCQQIEDMLINIMPRIIDTSFSAMHKGQRKFMLKHCRDMIDKMEAKYPAV